MRADGGFPVVDVMRWLMLSLVMAGGLCAGVLAIRRVINLVVCVSSSCSWLSSL